MRGHLHLALVLGAALAACGGGHGAPSVDAPVAALATSHSSSIAVSADGATVFVVNADSDSVSIIDTATRTTTIEIPLAGAPPTADGSGNYAPAVFPRALALSPDGTTLYVTGERAGKLYAIDVATRAVTGSVAVGSEPVGVAVAADGQTIYVACSQDATVVAVSAALAVTATVAVPADPWTLATTSDGTVLATHLLGPGVSAIDPATMMLTATWTIPDTAPRSDPRLAHGSVRGIYDVVPRPGTDQLWVAHVMLGIDTAQPALDFEETVFPSLSILHSDGTYQVTLSTDAQDVPGIDGSFADVVSGPHELAFTHDGDYALVIDTNSEDVLAVDANGRVESSLLRPLPGHMQEGIAISPDDKFAYIDERNTGDVAVVALDTSTGTLAMSVDGAVIPRFATDPMPAQLRLGQNLFFSANSDEYPITQNHWVSCASCHLEGRSDAVTWKFAQGPRDTPSNAGGELGTGFLFRTADRTEVQDYWRTINTEQGGSFDATAQATLLDAIAAFVNDGLPAPIPPTTDPVKVAAGAIIFARADVKCATCHSGPRFTDSGSTNPTLVLGAPIALDTPCTTAPCVVLHDVGTCNTGAYPDVAHLDIDGDARPACDFDTPSLTGVASSPPYFHDGRAATLTDVLEMTRGTMGDISSLSADDEANLVEYLRSL